MNQNKELVFKDLSARLPHHVRVKIWLKDGTTEEGFLDLEHNYGDVLQDAFFYGNKIKDIKPYLRSLSSMTEEEKKELITLFGMSQAIEPGVGSTPWYNAPETEIELVEFNFRNTHKLLDWLNAHHFDYRYLIEKGLAIEVTEDNNPYKK